MKEANKREHANNREITQENIKQAENLKRIWTNKKHKLGLTQRDIADKLSITQGAVSQYLNAHVALNTHTILEFAKTLKVSPEEIAPNILTNIKAKDIPVMFTTSGKKINKTIPAQIATIKDSVIAIYVDDENNHRYRQGEYVLVDTKLTPLPYDEIIIMKPDSARIIIENFNHYEPQDHIYGVIIGSQKEPR